MLTVILAPVLNWLTNVVIVKTSMYETPFWVFAPLTFALTLLAIFIRRLASYQTISDKPRIFARFADKKADGIMWITVRDQYVDVHTNRGLETLLMRFSDALVELDGMLGLQVHRSHWVASSAAVALKKVNGRTFVVLQDGTEVPVSRAYCDAVHAKFG